jgi:hypothetical protein
MRPGSSEQFWLGGNRLGWWGRQSYMMKIVIPARRQMLALAAVVALAACGTTADEQALGGAATTVAPTTLEVPADVVPGGGSAAPAGDPAVSESSRIAWMNFRYEGEMPVFDGPAPSWTYPAQSEPDVARVQALAAALGISGELAPIPENEGGGWSIGSTDGSAPGLMITTSGMLSWWYNSGPGDVSVIDECTIADDGSSVCPEPTPLVNVPSADEAKAKAGAIWTAAGYDLGSYDLEATSGEWGASVSAFLTLDGKRAPVQLSIGFGAEGVLTYASGDLGVPVRGADVPRITTAEALERLVQQNSGFDPTVLRGGAEVGNAVPTQGGGIGVSPAAEPSEPVVAENSQTNDPASEPIVDGASDLVPCPEPIIDPATDVAVGAPESAIDPATDVAVGEPLPAFVDCQYPEPEPVEIVLTGVTESLTMIWGNDNTVWLLPAYDFTDAEGSIFTVSAVADESVFTGIDPAAPIAVPAEDPEAPATAVACEADPESVPAITEPPSAGWTGSELVGLCLPDAEQLAASLDHTIRVVRADGVDLAVTADFSETRVNVATEGGVVTEVLNKG